MKKRFLFFAGMLLAVCFSGCTTVDGQPYGQGRVLAYVREAVPAEAYTLVSVEQVGESPANVEYTFRSEQRELIFRANSYLAQICIDTPTLFYQKEISCGYDEAVWALYADQVSAEFAKSDLHSGAGMELMDFEDIGEAAETLFSASSVLSGELAYNGEEYLREHLAKTVSVRWYADAQARAESRSWVSVCDVCLDGLTTEQTYYDGIANAYAQKVVDGEIPDMGDIPTPYLENKHLSRLEHIFLNGTEMTYDQVDNPFSSFRLSTYQYKTCWYNSEMGTYMMAVDVGYHAESASFPLIIAEYVQALNGQWEMCENGLKWSIGGDRWQLTCKRNSQAPYLTGLKLTKNGKAVPVSYLTASQDSRLDAVFCAALPLADFAGLFHLEYAVDEAAGCVYFTSAGF